MAAAGTPEGGGTTCATTTCGASTLPGFVPNGANRPGAPLTVSKSAVAGGLDLSWGASCSAASVDYAVYEGTIGAWYSHVPLTCSTGTLLNATVTPGAGSARYLLIVPIFAGVDGSHGLDSTGAERPHDGSTACMVGQVIICN